MYPTFFLLWFLAYDFANLRAHLVKGRSAHFRLYQDACTQVFTHARIEKRQVHAILTDYSMSSHHSVAHCTTSLYRHPYLEVGLGMFLDCHPGNNNKPHTFLHIRYFTFT